MLRFTAWVCRPQVRPLPASSASSGRPCEALGPLLLPKVRQLHCKRRAAARPILRASVRSCCPMEKQRPRLTCRASSRRTPFCKKLACGCFQGRSSLPASAFFTTFLTFLLTWCHNLLSSAETLASHGEDAMYMVDHHNYLRKAQHLGLSSAVLAGPLQHIGHGRVLGMEFDRDGNLIMCTAGIVSFYTSAIAVHRSWDS